MSYDLVLDYDLAKRIDTPDMFEYLQEKFPDRNLYKMSTDWKASSRYMLKAYGTGGDVLVGWCDE